MTAIASIPSGDTPARGRDRRAVPIHELLRRLVHAELRKEWFNRVLEVALRSDEVTERIQSAVNAAVNAAIVSHLRRPAVKELIRGMVVQVMAGARGGPSAE